MSARVRDKFKRQLYFSLLFHAILELKETRKISPVSWGTLSTVLPGGIDQLIRDNPKLAILFPPNTRHALNLDDPIMSKIRTSFLTARGYADLPKMTKPVTPQEIVDRFLGRISPPAPVKITVPLVGAAEAKELTESLSKFEYLYDKVKTIQRESQREIPARFEFDLARAFAFIYRMPMQTRYAADVKDFLSAEPSVIWRGRSEGFNPVDYAPSGAADVYVVSPDHYALIEATLATSDIRLDQEIRSLEKHVKGLVDEFPEKDKVYLLFIPIRLDQDVHRWVRYISGEFNVLEIDLQTVIGLVNVSYLTFGVPHAEIRKLLGNLGSAMKTIGESVDEYAAQLQASLNAWSKENVMSNLNLFIAFKTYEKLLQRGGLSRIIDLQDELQKDAEITASLFIAGFKEKELRRRKDDWVELMRNLLLARVINHDKLEALPIGETVRRIFNLHKYLTGLRKKQEVSGSA